MHRTKKSTPRRPVTIVLITLVTSLMMVLIMIRFQGSRTPSSTEESEPYFPPMTSSPHRIPKFTPKPTSNQFMGGMENNNIPLQTIEQPPQPSMITNVAIEVSAEFADAWKNSDKRKGFTSKITFLPEKSTASCVATFYGKSSLKLKYTRRRSLHISLHAPAIVLGVKMTNFLLLSLWEDQYKLAYRTSAKVLEKAGLFFPQSKLVELHCTGSATWCQPGTSLGVYLLIEYPSDAIHRVASENKLWNPDIDAELQSCLRQARLPVDGASKDSRPSNVDVSTRNWFYFESPKIYDLLHVPSYTRNSTLSSLYRKLETDVGLLTTRFDLPKYMTWIAINTALKNGDYDDEVFVFGTPNRLGIMAWDYDNVFAECHRHGKQAMKEPLMFCAETPIEKTVRNTPMLWGTYKNVLRCVLNTILTDKAWEQNLKESYEELEDVLKVFPKDIVYKASYVGSPQTPQLKEGPHVLSRDFSQHRAVLLQQIGQGPDFGTWHKVNGEGEVQPNEEDEQKCTVNKYRPPEVSSEFKWAASFTLSTSWLRANKIVRDSVLVYSNHRPEGVAVLADEKFTVSDSGLHCLTFKREGSACSDGVTFVIRDKERGKAEYGMPPYNVPPFRPSASISEVSDESLMTPKVYLKDRKWPAMVKVQNRMDVRVHSQDVPRGMGLVFLEGSLQKGKAVAASSFTVADVPHTVTTTTTLSGNVWLKHSITVANLAVIIIEAGTTLIMSPKVTITIQGSVMVPGTHAAPVVFMASSDLWNGFLVEGGSLNISHTFITDTGGTKTRIPGTGTHIKESPAITVYKKGLLEISGSVLHNMVGPGIGAGEGAKVFVRESVFQHVAQGIECTGCDFHASGTSWNFIAADPHKHGKYEDEDNDAIYLHGGVHSLTNCVIHGTQDDGIDTGGDTGSLTVTDSYIERCQHEGIALSSDDVANRIVKIERSTIRQCQQGIESGYSHKGHKAYVTQSIVEDNYIGIRYGDNYHNKPEAGILHITDTTIRNNSIQVMNLLRRKSDVSQLQGGVFQIKGGKIGSFVPPAVKLCQLDRHE
eukprot:PhF_6_TR8294/c0_g1_i1/m.12763